MRGPWISAAITLALLLIGVSPPGLGESLGALLVRLSATLTLTLTRRTGLEQRRQAGPGQDVRGPPRGRARKPAGLSRP